MSQSTDYTISNQGMPAARTEVNSILAAILSHNSGTARPAYAAAGTLWLDTDTPSATSWTLYLFDGTDDIAIGIFDSTANTFTPTNAAMLTAANVFTKTNTWKRGADVASAAALSLGDGNIFNVTGTTTITSIGTKGVGTIVVLRFTAALTLTHHATDLILTTGANITTVAGDYAIFEEYATGDWRMIAYQRASGAALAGASNLVQRAYASLATVQTGTTTIPEDDTIPQNTEGTEFLTLAITPTSATNRLRIRAHFYAALSTSVPAVMALFQDTTANALAVEAHVLATSPRSMILDHEMVAGTTSATTFKIRIGRTSAGMITINGIGGVRYYGGALISSITIDEIVP